MPRLVVVEGYGVRLRVRKGCLVVESRSGRKILPLAEIDRIVIVSSRVSITSAVVRILARYGIDLLFLDSRGVPVTMLTPPWITATVDTRRCQYLAYANPGLALSYAKSFAVAKLGNQSRYLRYLAKTTGVRELEEDARKIEEKILEIEKISGELDEARKSIMGIEGNAARIYWGALATVLPKDLGFGGRDQDSNDPMNACLNYLYGVLYAECFKALARYGLDPYAGFLHVDRSGKPVLTFDFIEMFRVSAVDSLLVKLFREGFRPSYDGELLSRETRGKLVVEMQRWLDRKAREVVGETKPLREHLKSHALKLARALRSFAPYNGFVEAWWR